MTLETFFEKFDIFADTPDAVAKMREVICQLAVQGKLVPQDQTEEHAAVLLEQIRRARAALSSNRRGGDETDTATFDGESDPYTVPSGWVWTSLGTVQVFTNGYAFKSQDYRESGVGIIRMGELGVNGEIDETNMKYVSSDIADSLPETFRVKPGDLLMGMSGSIGKLAINRSDKTYLLNQRVGRLEPILIQKAFLHVFLKTVEQHYLRISFGMAIKNLSTKQINETPFPLPPLAEQKRIVAKVDELMALCDRLEGQQQERETRHAALVRASLARFADAPTPANLDLLFHKSYSILPADLRKSILTLAVQGKLVPQDPDDEPAEELNSKLPNQLRAIADKVGARFSAPGVFVEGCDDLPAGWGLAAIQSIGITQTGTTPSKSESSFTGRDIPFIKPGDIQGDTIDYENEGLSAVGLSAGRLIPKGSVLMVSIGGSIGKTALVDRDVSCNQQINCVSPAECIEPRYVLTAIRSGDIQAEVMKRAAQGTLPIISKGRWETIRIPVPPLAEQRRIVAKVDELMALVDALETQLVTARTTRSELVDAVVSELTAEV